MVLVEGTWLVLLFEGLGERIDPVNGRTKAITVREC